MSNDDEEMEQNRQKEIEQRRREKIEKELFNESLSTEKDRLKAAMDKIARTIDPINWQKPDRGYNFEHNDWRRNMPLLLTTIQELEVKGYQVENCFALNQYPIFAREARLSSYVGFLNRANAHEYGCHNDMGKYIQPLGMRPVANLPNILQGEPAQVQSIEPGSTLAANFGPPVIVNHALLNGIHFTLLYYQAQPSLRYVHYKGGQLIGFCPKQKPEFIYVTDDKTPYIYLSELDNIFRPQGINKALVPVATLEHDYLAHYLPLAHMTAVWQNVHQAGLEDRMKFLGFAKGRPEAINVETDYYYTLGRPNTPSYPDYPMGLPFYAYRRNKKPKDAVIKTTEEVDKLRPVALIHMLQERQVDFRCRWSKEDGMFALYDNHAKEGGLVLVGDDDNLYRWDGARNYLERHMTVNEMIQRHDEAKTRAQAKAEADRLVSEAKAEAKARKALKSRKVTKAEKETDASSGMPAPEPQVAAKQFTITGGAFGKATFFVKEKDGAANAGNPLSWPIGSQQEIDDKKYRLNSAWGNIEVEHDPGKMVESFRFYNKVHQRNCYAYSVANVSGSLSLPLPSIIWEYERDKKQEEELSLRFGYKRKQMNNITDPIVAQVDVDKPNMRKFITQQGDKHYYLSVIGSTENDVTTTVTSTSGLNLVAVGAANRTSVSAYDTSIIEKQSDSTKGLVVLKGTQLEELLRGASSECKTVDLLARSPESYDKATMWKLTRDIADESSSALPIRDIGIRTFSNDVEIFAGNKSQEEKTLLSRNQLVRFFVALVPDDKDSDKHEHSDINVVSVQDVHPVDGELHIVYLLHHKGEFYSQQIYSSVILLSVQLSSIFVNRFLQLYENPKLKVKVGKPKMASKESAIKVRGYYNKFWKLVCDPTKEEDVDHATLYARWQHFYQHDFLGFNYLASPVNIYEPDEIHLVNVADFLRENNIMNQPFIGESENRGEKVFLSGAFNESQSYIGAPFVVYNNYMVQVEVPDVIKIKCVIYDFEGLEEYLNDHSEDKAKAIFREMSQLTKVGDSQIPQRLYFSRVEVNGSGKDFSLETSQSQEDEQKKILVKCSEELSNYTQGCIQLNLFYFVSHVGIDHIKVGVANVPFNCRSFVTHHQSLCRNVLERNYGNVERKLHCVDYKFPDRKKAKKMAVRDKYPVRGCLWREGGNPIVGIVEGRKAVQYVAQASLFTSLADTSTTVAFMARHDYSQANAAGIAPQPAPEGSASYNSNDKVTVFVNTPASERMLELTHFVRQISSPIFDVAKGYPVHSFYNLNPQSGSIADPIFNQLVQRFDAFINADGHGSLPAQAGNMDTSRARTSQGGSRDPPTGSPQQDSDLYPLIAILSASAALYLFL